MAHIDVVFPAFSLQSKCTNPDDRVSYEIYAKSGELVYDRSAPCSKKLKVTLEEGTYSIEGKVKEAKATSKINVSTKEQHNAVLDFTKQNHEEEIKADTPPQNNTKDTNNKPKTITVGDKVINIDGLSNEQIKKLKDMQKMLEMFGGIMQGNNAAVKTETKNNRQNDKADKEFEEMSKDLDMFTK